MLKPATIDQTILFSDIAGSTFLYERLGDARGRDLVAACIELMVRVAQTGGGRIVKTMGDEVMCRFENADRAARTAVCMQEAVCSDAVMVSNRVRLRIGLHHGPVIEDSGDLFGDAVNMAAHMVAQAKAGQIITTRSTLEGLDAKLIAAARLVDQARIKGKLDPIEIYELSWGQPEEVTVICTPKTALDEGGDSEGAFLILDTPEVHLRIDREVPSVTLGRDASNRILINDPKVSRLHARIEMRRAKFILVDQSTNGTFVLPQDGKMIHLRRDETTLEGEGLIGLGREPSPDAPFVIRYCAL
jgi:adenylate cyclase